MGLNKVLRGSWLWGCVLLLCALAPQALAAGIAPPPGLPDLWAAAAALGCMLLSASPGPRR